MEAIVRAERVAGVNTNEIEVKRNGNKKIYKYGEKTGHAKRTTTCVRRENHVQCVRDRRRSHAKIFLRSVFGGLIEAFLKR